MSTYYNRTRSAPNYGTIGGDDPVPRLMSARARRTDPDTSKDAARSVRNIGDTQREIIDLLSYSGMTDHEFNEYATKWEWNVSSRCFL